MKILCKESKKDIDVIVKKQKFLFGIGIKKVVFTLFLGTRERVGAWVSVDAVWARAQARVWHRAGVGAQQTGSQGIFDGGRTDAY